MPPETARTASPLRATWSLDVSDALPVQGPLSIAASWIAPPDLRPGTPVPLLVCLPGGFLSRRYFDLEIGGARRYSFAEAMAARGYAVLALDHVGTGDSPKPSPEEAGLSLGVDAIAATNQRALELARKFIETGDPDGETPPLEISRSIGVGHSMGSMLTVEQQALARPHDGLVLFSFSTAGTPFHTSSLDPDGIFLSNGPGDPAAVEGVQPIVRELAQQKPVFGICLGHQILGLALGGSTRKLKFGHHGGNQPGMDLATGKVAICAENHGYAVEAESLRAAGEPVMVTHVNLNDETVEGLAHEAKPLFSVQYHPEASPGPHDAAYFFSRFREMVERSAAGESVTGAQICGAASAA